ncbi:Os04g0383100 [Oryza sativa Japonica Group]|jgi:hypothetical protein|uniref:Os04g0383100 protein n=3 Tax=Oryza TaxID=4527 RepID=A0A0P0W9Z8_ORYSJ|nr:hypothetical protein OsJ_14539 [Oryza sativa Japonica Group]KAF2933673.1 hypothetical protein DAI22_04g103366 [Oryza sativa Japonica Group]BAH92634.1 Os04g0383100 [Oryza sativa Japonica Group]BAS88909.1 Os04g0383100 [Oryza sativa Japonica Group]|eukprot:NP_001173906.1 Os04g0383100 [Oryza sativa Japonica Group]
MAALAAAPDPPLDAAAAMAAPAGGTVASTSSVAAAVWSRATVEETVVELEPLLPADQLDMVQSRRVWSTTKHDTGALDKDKPVCLRDHSCTEPPPGVSYIGWGDKCVYHNPGC